MKQTARMTLSLTISAVALMLASVHQPVAAAPPTATHGTGLVFAAPKDFAKYPHILVDRAVDTDRPAQLILTDYLPPVGDQGKTGSCVGWSTAYYCFSYTVAKDYQLTQEQMQDPKFLFSPNFIWDQFNHGNPEQGMHIFEAMDVLAKQGCCSFQEMPWDPTGLEPSDDAAKARAQRYKARQTINLFQGPPDDPADPEKLRTYLWETKRPFVVGITVFDDFFNVPHDDDYVYTPSPTAKPEGGHGICIVGYDEDKHAFRMVNSWTTAWGNNGFLWLSEDYLRQYGHEGWAQRPGGPVARGTGVQKLVAYKHLSLAPAKTPVHLLSR